MEATTWGWATAEQERNWAEVIGLLSAVGVTTLTVYRPADGVVVGMVEFDATAGDEGEVSGSVALPAGVGRYAVRCCAWELGTREGRPSDVVSWCVDWMRALLAIDGEE